MSDAKIYRDMQADLVNGDAVSVSLPNPNTTISVTIMDEQAD